MQRGVQNYFQKIRNTWKYPTCIIWWSPAFSLKQ